MPAKRLEVGTVIETKLVAASRAQETVDQVDEVVLQGDHRTAKRQQLQHVLPWPHLRRQAKLMPATSNTHWLARLAQRADKLRRRGQPDSLSQLQLIIIARHGGVEAC